MNKDYMLKMKPKVSINSISPPIKTGGFDGAGVGGWEVRPGGMLVQQRISDSNLVPKIKVNVKYGSCYHEVIISSQASFGELKKMLAGVTGLNPQDQKLMFKEKERESKVFLDIAGVKDRSKIVLIEDELSRERRCVESRKNVKMDKASMEIAAIRIDVDKLAKQVSSAELEINGSKQVVETLLLNLIELLMAQLIKLDAIAADGDVKLQRRMQVKRVQKYIETLDILKMRNSGLGKPPLQQKQKLFTREMPITTFHKQQQEQRKLGIGNFILNERANSRPVMVTTKWQTF